MSFLSAQGSNCTFNNLLLTGNLTVGGNIDISGSSVYDDVIINDTLTVGGKSTFNNNVAISENVDISGSLNVVGNILTNELLTNSIYNNSTGNGGMRISSTLPGEVLYINNDRGSEGGDLVLNAGSSGSNVNIEYGNLNLIKGDLIVTNGNSTLSDTTTVNNLVVNGTFTSSVSNQTSEILTVQVGGSDANVSAVVNLANNVYGTENYAVFPSVYYGYHGSGATYNLQATSSALNTIVIGGINVSNFTFSLNKLTGDNVNIILVFLVVYNLPGSNYSKNY